LVYSHDAQCAREAEGSVPEASAVNKDQASREMASWQMTS
jgi:hypothetical protein